MENGQDDYARKAQASELTVVCWSRKGSLGSGTTLDINGVVTSPPPPRLFSRVTLKFHPGTWLKFTTFVASGGGLFRGCLLLQYLIQSGARGGRRIVEDM